MQITKIKNGELGINNSVFIAFYTDPSLIYQRHQDCKNWPNNAWDTKIALLGVMIRYNSVFGFVGGHVDTNESLVDAALRECMEEVNYKVDTGDLDLICSHNVFSDKKEQNTHLFKCKVDVDTMYKIRKLSCDAEHGEIECAAFSVIHLTSDAQYALLNTHPWAGSARNELAFLLSKICDF